MRHFFSKRIRVVLVLAVLLAVGLAVVSNLTNLSIPDMVVKGILTPIRAGASKLTDQAEQLYSYMFRYETLEAENEALKQELAKMRENARKYDSLLKENDRLRAAMGLLENHEDYALLDAYIISWSSGSYANSFTINRGENAGLEVGMCAITANREVVGLISEVGPNYAVVRTVLDSALEISAVIADSGNNGMVQGGYAAGETGLLRMDYLPSDAVIRNRDQVVTSGSTVYPRDLILGHVVDAGFDDTGVAKFALLEPAADFGSLEQVFILTAYNVG